jgi:hypothetical protein
MSAATKSGNPFTMKLLAAAIAAALATGGCYGAVVYLQDNQPEEGLTKTMSLGISFTIVLLAALLANYFVL